MKHIRALVGTPVLGREGLGENQDRILLRRPTAVRTQALRNAKWLANSAEWTIRTLGTR